MKTKVRKKKQMFALQQHNTVLIKERDGRFGFIHYCKLAAHTALKQTNLIINKIKVIYVALEPPPPNNH